MDTTPVPSYKNPPVVEVVWSVQFAKLHWLTAGHTGLFWNCIRKDYPKCEEHPPIERKREPEEILQPPEVVVEVLTKPPLCRQWFISPNGNDLVQVQPDRFCVNWRKVGDSDQYPRYAYVRKVFSSRWEEWRGFVISQGGQEPEVDLLEMTYVNHIFQQQGWGSPKDIGNVLPAISFHEEGDFLPPPATLGSNMVFDICGPRGRLHVSCRHGRLMNGKRRELFRLELVARGRPERTSPDDLLAWFAKAREWIVRGFADLTNKDIQDKAWGRER